MASQQPYQLYTSNPLTPALSDILILQPNDAGATEVGACTFDDIPLSTDAIAADTAVGAAATAKVLAATGNPKVYKAYVGQASTAAPIPSALVNTFSGTPAYTRSSTGVYVLTLTGAFTLFKTFIPRLLQFYPGGSTNIIKITITQDSANTITIRTYLGALGSEVLTDGVLTTANFDIEIYVYP